MIVLSLCSDRCIFLAMDFDEILRLYELFSKLTHFQCKISSFGNELHNQIYHEGSNRVLTLQFLNLKNWLMISDSLINHQLLYQNELEPMVSYCELGHHVNGLDMINRIEKCTPYLVLHFDLV